MAYPPMSEPYDPAPVSVPAAGPPSYGRPSSAPPSHHIRRPFTPRSDSRKPLLEELIPTPDHPDRRDSIAVLRRTGSVAILSIFLLSVIFLASTEGRRQLASQDLRNIFGAGIQAEVGNGWLNQDLEGGSGSATDDVPAWEGAQPGHGMPAAPENTKPQIDFERYTILRTLPPASVDTSNGKRLIFIGDVHGSYAPLKRLMDKISYDSSNDLLIHVGDLIAKGDKNEEVLQWMNDHAIMGVRGNHDQPVIQWRTWMEWAGGDNWESFIDNLASGGETGVLRVLNQEKKMFPSDWTWKGEHWQIARHISASSYDYLLRLPLTLHMPSLHTIVVHAGLLPSDPTKSSFDISQPLIGASNRANLSNDDAGFGRTSEELQILFNIPQNSVPWNLLNMRSVITKGRRKGEVTKASNEGKPWSDIWKKEMGRCKGHGSWLVDGMGEWEVEHAAEVEDSTIEQNEDAEFDETLEERDADEPEAGAETELKCSPVTIIYGHAAGRGLDIKPYSKGIDTGCVYGKELTVLILGNTDGLDGKQVRVGDSQGILVHESCGRGGQ